MTDRVVAVGDRIGPLDIDEVLADHIRIMALVLRDPNPIHFDLEAVARAGLGTREVLQGGVSFGWVITLLSGWAGSRASVRSVDCRFLANLFAGDRVRAEGRVTAVDGRSISCEVWAERQDGGRAIEGAAVVDLGPAVS